MKYIVSWTTRDGNRKSITLHVEANAFALMNEIRLDYHAADVQLTRVSRVRVREVVIFANRII